MKKYILILLAVIVSSCTEEEAPKNCHCNRVISISDQPLPGSTTALGSYVTKNDCDGSFMRTNFSKTFPCPKIGDCE